MMMIMRREDVEDDLISQFVFIHFKWHTLIVFFGKFFR